MGLDSRRAIGSAVSHSARSVCFSIMEECDGVNRMLNGLQQQMRDGICVYHSTGTFVCVCVCVCVCVVCVFPQRGGV